MNTQTLIILIIAGGAILLALYTYLSSKKKDTTRPKKQEPTPLTSSEYVPESITTEKKTPAEKTFEEEETTPEGTLFLEPTTEEPETETKEEKETPESPPEEKKKEQTTEPEPRPDTPIIEIEGIGPTYSERLKDIGIHTVEELLEQGATRKQREDLAEKTDISPNLILEWVNHADLYRVKGVAGQYSDLLEEAGVNTVPELARRNPENLHNTIMEINQEKNLVNRVPSLSNVQDWINQAKELPRKIEH
jgi:predicted flap endonuclease-1-like 5' DNA nuclease